MATVKFEESQKFNQWWLWTLLLLIFVSPALAQWNSLMENGFWGTFSKGIYGHIITIGLVILLFLILRLDTRVDESGISIHYFPFLKRNWNWTEIESTEIVQYSFTDVLGWGIRWGGKYGTTYNVRGYKGVVLYLKSGKTRMIGTQHSKELKKVLLKLEK